tara:strand:+ start:609 stop:1106 length:498 start_codon:yes stop_codon:yes gene_type:complete
MTKLTKILTIAFLFQCYIGQACRCAPPQDHDKLIERSFNNYENIYTGEIIKKNHELWIIVNEVFKGDLKPGQELKTGYQGNSCSYYFRERGMAIFYGTIIDNEFFASICSPTRMFERPYLFPVPSPPEPDSENDSDAQKQRWKEYEKTERQRLEYEIEQLRKRKN